jgi:hypothetical protein
MDETIAPELTNCEDGFLKDKQYLIMDRDTTFTSSFRACLQHEGVKQVRLPRRSPSLNRHPDRFFGVLNSECLQKLDSLRRERDAKSCACIRHSLSHRTESSRFGQRLDRPDGETARHGCRDRNDRTSWWLASVVSSRGLTRSVVTRSALLRSQDIG